MGVFIIAEAGVNHNGEVNLAKELIHAAAKAGADAVKFQTFRAEALASGSASCAPYQKRGNYDDQRAMLTRLELPLKAFEELLDECRRYKVQFLSSPFDVESAQFLHHIGMEIYKIASGELTNFPLLREIAQYGKPVILSTGMANLGEIEWAVETLVRFGVGRDKITLLHCNTAYPTPMEEVNLRAMCTLQAAFQCPVGYSDHTLGIEVPVAAVALGAQVIEKHFTLDRSLPGPDHAASLEPKELSDMVRAIRNIEAALGCGLKKVTRSEQENISAARKSIVARCNIKKGETFTEENITTKRPGTGIPPTRWEEVVGRKAARDFGPDELIEL